MSFRRHLVIGFCAMVLLSIPAGSQEINIKEGQLSVTFRDNSGSPGTLSGVQALFHMAAAPGFDAYDPDSRGASAGLNFEHIISGHRNNRNAFTPRQGPYELEHPAPNSVELVRSAEDGPWKFGSRMSYTVVGPHYIDFDFRGTADEPGLFGERNYGVFFFANYMNNVSEVPIVFRGIEESGGDEKWIHAGAPAGHPDYKGGGTYRNAAAGGLEYDPDHDQKLNLWSYDYPRFTKPFYYGRAAYGMVLILMFDTAYSERDEIRFSLFKFKVPKIPRPAWDFQYVVHEVEPGVEYGFKGRLVWKKFVSAEDCMKEYESFAGALRR